MFDGIIDCPNDGSDESLEICSKLTRSINFKNKQRITSKCPLIYYMTVKGQCYIHFPLKDNPQWSNNCQMLLTCKNGKSKDYQLVNDLVADCGSEGKEEQELKSLLFHHNKIPCSHPDQLPCRKGHSICYNATDICKYKLNESGHLTPCRTGDHLQNCKEFECNLMFKYYKLYCIHWNYVKDGKRDCPYGEDEIFMINCKKMFKCRNTKHTCVHVGNVCDGYNNCPMNNDEFLCSLKGISCAQACICFALTIHRGKEGFNFLLS